MDAVSAAEKLAKDRCASAKVSLCMTPSKCDVTMSRERQIHALFLCMLHVKSCSFVHDVVVVVFLLLLH